VIVAHESIASVLFVQWIIALLRRGTAAELTLFGAALCGVDVNDRPIGELHPVAGHLFLGFLFLGLGDLHLD
jgi:hypothetical protein